MQADFTIRVWQVASFLVGTALLATATATLRTASTSTAGCASPVFGS